MLELIGFDADDTLWHNERLYLETRDRYVELLSEYHTAEWIEERLYETEVRNLHHFGYGIKSFTLSMIETAIELTEGRITATQIREIVDFAKHMVEQPVKLLEGAEDAVRELARTYRLTLITKGDLFDQESKVARSGLGDYFHHVEVVSEKGPEIYRQILDRLEVDPEKFLMVGNSLKSDIIPVLDIGCRAIHVPYETTWKHEEVAREEIGSYRYLTAAAIEEVPSLISRLSAAPSRP